MVEPGRGIDAMGRKRSHCLYCVVISRGPLVMVRMPEEHTAWRPMVIAIHEFMRDDLDIKAKDISAIEGMAGYPDPDSPEEDHAFLEKCGIAFEGSDMHIPAFMLYAWDEAAGGFRLKRKAAK